MSPQAGMNYNQKHTKHVPERTCISCRQVKAKREMIRLVRVAEGKVEVDISGKKTGRGAYLCSSPECWESGFSAGRLEHVLRTSLSRENREEIIEQGKLILRGVQ